MKKSNLTDWNFTSGKDSSWLQTVLSLASISKRRYLTISLSLGLIGVLDVAAIASVSGIIFAFESPEELPEIMIKLGLDTVGMLIGVLGLIYAFKIFFAIFTQRFLFKVVANSQLNLIQKLLQQYLNYDYYAYSKANPNELINNITKSIHIFINQCLYPCLRAPSELITALLISISLSIVNPYIPLAVLLTFGVATGIYFASTHKKVSSLGDIFNSEQSVMLGVCRQAINGYEELTASNSIDLPLDLLKNSATKYAKAGADYYSLLIIPRQFLEAMFIFFFGASMIAASNFGYNLNEVAMIGGVFAFGALRFIPVISNLIGYLSDLKFSTASVDKLIKELKFDHSKSKIKYKSNGIKNICGKEIGFKYDKVKVLEGLNFEFSSNGLTCIVGKSGAGKSTLLRIILGALSPTTGSLSVNSHQLNNERLCATLIGQDVFILNATISQNVTMNLGEHLIDQERLACAIKSAQMNSFVNSLDLGINTIIGDGGLALSGGQRQRIALARAFYADTDIIVLDEPTSSLDKNTAELVWKELIHLGEHKIVIVVTHDLALASQSKNIIHL